MSEQAQMKALAAAGAASEGMTALIEFARHGGDPADITFEHDAIQMLADATRLALEARGVIDGEEGQLYAALVRWLAA